MTKKEAKERIEKLKKEIEHHRYLYHVLDKQEISDAASDSLKHELQQLEEQYPEYVTPDSPTQRVGGKPLDAFVKARHSTPMISLNDVFTFNEVQAWEKRIRKLIPGQHITYFAELKMDGLAISLRYENGILTRAATRGDSQIGEDVTQNIKTIDAIPLRLHEAQRNFSKIIEVRGEVYMSKHHFEDINRKQEKSGLPLFANPRNAAAGAVRQLDQKITKSRKLSFLAYDCVTDLDVLTHKDVHDVLQKLGFASGIDNRLCKSIEEVDAYHKHVADRRSHLPFWVDGIVVSVNEIAAFKRLGVVGKAPRGAVAYKYPAEQATTIVEDIAVQVGRTGALTPVAHLKSVRVAGSTVSRATLHNADEIRRLGVKIGDTVIVEKAGDIIPDVVKVLVNLRTGKERPFRMPKKCPVCGSIVVQKPAEVQHYCANRHCFAQTMQGLEHFVSKKGFDIDGLGPKILEQLMRQDLIRDSADIFTLTESDLEPLERFAEKSASNLIAAIHKARRISFYRFINALGIRHVGEQTAKELARRFGTLQRLSQATRGQLFDVDDIGDVVSDSILAYFKDRKIIKLLAHLHDHGVVIEKEAKATRGPLSGKRLVVTGTLAGLSREEAKQAIEDAGGRWTSTVSENTDYVVIGENPGSKAAKAKKLNRPILTEATFVALIKR